VHGLLGENIGAEPLGFFKGPVVSNGGIKIKVPWGIATGAGEGLADAAAAVDEDFVKTALLGLVFVFVTQMPFPKNACAVPRFLQYLGKRGGLRSQPLTF